MNFEPSATVREITQQCPSSFRVFEELGIDYCCGGNKSLAEAAKIADVSLEQVLARLEAASETGDGAALPHWQDAPLSSLTRHIVERHHAFVRTEAPRLQALAGKVSTRHGSAHPELLGISLAFGFLADEMINHMQKEEQVLFPYIERLEQAIGRQDAGPTAPFVTVAQPVECMMRDHDKAAGLMRKVRDLSKGFTLPEGACNSFRALYAGLKEFEQDLHRHVHLENNILFPRALHVEDKSCTPA